MRISPWQPVHASITLFDRPLPPESECRRNEVGTIVLTLHPEWTRDGNKSQAWVWKLPSSRAKKGPLYGVNWGADPDKGVARQQADEALKRHYGKLNIPLEFAP